MGYNIDAEDSGANYTAYNQDGYYLHLQYLDFTDNKKFTYHDYDDIWSYGLHFKWRNQPDHLVLLDNGGFELDFYPTSLENALAARQSKTIHDY